MPGMKASMFQCAETQKRRRERSRMKTAAVRCEKAKGLVSASGAKVLDSDEVLARWNVLELQLKLGQHPDPVESNTEIPVRRSLSANDVALFLLNR